MKRVRRVKEKSDCTMFSLGSDQGESYIMNFIDCKIQIRYWKIWFTIKKYTIKLKTLI